MSSPADLLSILNGQRPMAGVSAGGPSGPSETTILQFKAGKMTTAIQPSGKFLIEPDTRRGELHVVWTKTAASGRGGGGANNASSLVAGGHLALQWKDRRTRATVDTIAIFPEDNATYERVDTGRDGDRVYLLTVGENRHFFWMQDKNDADDDENTANINLYAADYAEASRAAREANGEDPDADGGGAGPAASSSSGAAAAGGMDNSDLLQLMRGALGDAEGGAAASSAAPTGGVPAGQAAELGSILDTLGMGQPGGSAAASSAATAAGPPGGTASGGLTLADLQGAMAGLATASPPGAAAAANPPGPPLSELATADVVESSGILSDPAVVERLTALLPEGQRDLESLRENVRSPQVAQCLQRLTAALCEDAGGFNSIIANFQLDPSDGAAALAGGNPVEAFLLCLLRDVERKEGVKKKEDGDEEEKDGGGDGGGEEKDGEGDAPAAMDES